MKAKNEKTASFLDNSIKIHHNDDTKIIRVILDSDPTISFENHNDNTVQKKYLIKKLKKRIEELEKFSKLYEILLENIQKT